MRAAPRLRCNPFFLSVRRSHNLGAADSVAHHNLSPSGRYKVHQKALAEGEIASVIYYALVGLEYLHSNQKVHRDVKGANILLTALAQVKLCDLGVSAMLATPLAKRKTLVGLVLFFFVFVLVVGFDSLQQGSLMNKNAISAGADAPKKSLLLLAYDPSIT